MEDLLRRPAVVAAVRVLGALRRLGAVRIEVQHDYACVLEVAGEQPERGRGPTVLHAALACWAAALEGLQTYRDRGVSDLERFLVEQDGQTPLGGRAHRLPD